MAAFIDRLTGTNAKTLWLDYTDYAGKLLASGAPPWLDVSACVAWQRKAQSLLGSDVITIPLAAVCAAWLQAHAPLREAMAAKSRTMFPLKTLLADDALRAHLVELARGLRGSFAGLTVALDCPSPRCWVVEAYRQARGPDVDIVASEDDVDSAALYIADFLRAFGACEVDALLLQESAESEPDAPADLACYQAVLNVAAHYRWDAGLSVPGLRYPGGSAGFAFVVAPRPLPGSREGCVVPAEFWSGAPSPECPANGFRFAVVPAGAKPESVLDRLALLR